MGRCRPGGQGRGGGGSKGEAAAENGANGEREHVRKGRVTERGMRQQVGRLLCVGDKGTGGRGGAPRGPGPHSCMSSWASSTATAGQDRPRGRLRMRHAHANVCRHAGFPLLFRRPAAPSCATPNASPAPRAPALLMPQQPAARTLELLLLLLGQRPRRLDQMDLLLQLPPVGRRLLLLGLGHARLVEAVLPRRADGVDLLDGLDCSMGAGCGGAAGAVRSPSPETVRWRAGTPSRACGCTWSRRMHTRLHPGLPTHPSCAPARGHTSRDGCAAAPSQTWRPARQGPGPRGPALRGLRWCVSHATPPSLAAGCQQQQQPGVLPSVACCSTAVPGTCESGDPRQARPAAPPPALCLPACDTPWST